MSDLNAYVQKTIQRNLNKFGTILRNCIYIHIPIPTYNPTTGVLTPGVEVQYPIKMILATFNLTKTQSSESMIGVEPIKERDKKGLISALDLSVTPLLGNVILVSEEVVRYQIMGLNHDPTKSIWLFHLRPVKDGA